MITGETGIFNSLHSVPWEARPLIEHALLRPSLPLHPSRVLTRDDSVDPSWWEDLSQNMNKEWDVPTNRRSHDSTYFYTEIVDPNSNNSRVMREWMIVSGGFTDDDFCSFPVWALDLNQVRDLEENRTLEGNSRKSPWIQLDQGIRNTGKNLSDPLLTNCGHPHTLDSTRSPERPPGRMGHLSGVGKDGTLFVLGGLRVHKDQFSSADHGDKLTVWSAPILPALLGNEMSKLQWTRTSNYTTDNFPPIRSLMAGGVWREENKIVFHGGVDMGSKVSVYNDIWAFSMNDMTFQKLLEQSSSSVHRVMPSNRAAHKGAFANNTFFIFGGMAISEAKDGAYLDQYHSSWSTLSDVWEFHVGDGKWAQRKVTPQLSRAYHSLEVMQDGSLISYGGNRRGQTMTGEAVAYVYGDLMILEQGSSRWMKITMPPNSESLSKGPQFRFDHTSIYDRLGNLFVWGGRMQRVNSVDGLYKFFLPNATVVQGQLIPELADQALMMETQIESLQFVVLVMLICGIVVSAIYTSYRWRMIHRIRGENGSGAGSIHELFATRRPGRNGTRRELFESIPVKIYNPDDPDINAEDCCAICMEEYVEGAELKCLPCGHNFHVSCIEHWLQNNTNCPTCRQELSSSEDLDRPAMQGYVTHSRLWGIINQSNGTGIVFTIFPLRHNTFGMQRVAQAEEVTNEGMEMVNTNNERLVFV